MFRPWAEMIPALTLEASPKGLPIATTQSPTRIQSDPDCHRSFDHVVVGQHRAVRIDDEARTQPLPDLLASTATAASSWSSEEAIEKVIGFLRARGELRCRHSRLDVHVDHRRLDGFHQRRQRGKANDFARRGAGRRLRQAERRSREKKDCGQPSDCNMLCFHDCYNSSPIGLILGAKPGQEKIEPDQSTGSASGNCAAYIL